uniref:Glutathione peroxidase 4a n=2 Tax=Pygocentrus nattereri TaxID=42514 RepID=A0AAR2L1Z2_PYGNA
MHFLGSAVLFSMVLQAVSAQVEDWQMAKSIYEFTATDIDGNEVSLEKYR